MKSHLKSNSVVKKASTMEILCQRFPLVAQKIMSYVDNNTLINFKEAGRNNVEYLRKERFYWIRIIQRYSCLFGELQEVWNKVISRTPIEIIKELAVAVHKLPQTMLRQHEVYGLHMTLLEFVQKREKHWHPLVISAACGSVNLCSHIVQKVGVKNLCLSKSCGKNTPLAVAVEYMRDISVFKLLLETAEDKNPILTNWNKTLLHELAWYGHLEMCGLMLEKVDNNSPQCVYGSTPFDFAVSKGRVEVCRLLMKYIDKNPLDCGLLNESAYLGQLDECNLLLEVCVDKNHSIDDSVRIPLHVAAFCGDEKVVRFFMSKIVDKNLRYNKGHAFFFTPLLTAIKGGHLNVCKLLIEGYKVDVNVPNHSGMTPLHLASKMGRLEICKLLCKYVPNKNTLDSDGKTPIDMAVSVRKWNIVSFLKNSRNPVKNYKIN